MSDLTLALGSFPLLVMLLLLRVPIGLAMLVLGMVGTSLVLGSTAPVLAHLKSVVFDTFSNYSLSVVPLFLLMGQFATKGGISRALFEAARALFGAYRGGMAMAAVGACGIFGALSGSSLATAATMGQVALPELKRFGTSPALASGTLAAGGTLGILIPPSIVLVIYAVLAEQNIVELFMAALLPGLLALFGYLLTIALYVRVIPHAAGNATPMPPTERAQAWRRLGPVILVIATVIGGLYAGWFTPAESAAVGAIATLLLALAKGMRWAGCRDALLETASVTAMIYFLILGAAVYNGFLGFARLPQLTEVWVTAQALAPWVVLGTVLLIYLVLGCLMDSLSMIILTVPIFLPMLASLDLGLRPDEFALWFGILVLVTVEVGLITPPVGLNLFVIGALSRDTPTVTIFKGVLPFVLSDLVRIALLLAFPAISLSLVRWLS